MEQVQQDCFALIHERIILNCEIVDNLDKIGGQCIELYPDKPIYDIPAIPECTGEELTNNLIKQIKPFNIKFHLNERVEEIKKVEKKWIIKTNKNKEFETPNIIIAGGVGSFEPRKFAPKECEKYENQSLFYSIKKNIKTKLFQYLDTLIVLVLRQLNYQKAHM